MYSNHIGLKRLQSTIPNSEPVNRKSAGNPAIVVSSEATTTELTVAQQ